MAKDTSNLPPKPVTVRKQGTTMKTSYPGDMKVHTAAGERKNTSAARYADAMDKVIGGQTSRKPGFGNWP